ncbi:MAG TPA: ankyrin repeat domain-containing protein [Candidatus Babeliales bacterium]|nr:ankyrin repeat domain-containing protein [Candidatus Babeliales bacterium]
MKNLSKNNPILSRILPVFLLTSMTLSSLQINSMEKASNSSRAGIAIGVASIAAVCWASYKYWIKPRLQTQNATKVLTPVLEPISTPVLAPIEKTTAKDAASAQAKLNQQLDAAIVLNVPAYVAKALQDGADVNAILADPEGCTPLMFAILKGADTIVKLLLEHGADINAVTRSGWTALSWAARKSSRHHMNVEVITLLLQAGAIIPDDLNDNEFIQAALVKLCDTSTVAAKS